MFTFIHAYTKESWPGILSSGLWHQNHGLKLMHKTYLPSEYQFNSCARVGSALYSTLAQLKCPFYIDRLQGGISLPLWYEYDKALLAAYKEMLGDNFWGFQMHEWASNLRQDYSCIAAAMQEWRKANPALPTTEFYKAAQVKGSAFFVCGEAKTMDEFSKTKMPADYREFTAELKALWKKRLDETGGPLLVADSFFPAPKIETAAGVKVIMPEIGWQIPGTRFQIAYARGMARAKQLRWGVYYECWGLQEPDVLTMPYAVNSRKNEWIEDGLLDKVMKDTGGRAEFGGSSRSLQERCWIYSYFSGATVMSEEYGICNTFRNYDDFELSEYGQVKKKFLDFVEENPDLGVPYTPIALVLPADMDVYSLSDSKDSYLHYPLYNAPSRDGTMPVDEEMSQKVTRARQAVGELLFRDPYAVQSVGKDDHCLQNNAYPDVFDVVHSDMAGALDRYAYLIDLSGDGKLKEKHANCIEQSDVHRLLEQLLPCTLTANLHYLFNKTPQGWLLLVMNNNGVIRTGYRGDRFDPAAEITGRVLWKNEKEKHNLRVVHGSGRLTRGKEDLLTLGAGQWMILSID